MVDAKVSIERMKLFNHVQIKVKDLEVGKRFYDRIMEVLGYSMVLETAGEVIGYGTSVHDMFEIKQTSSKAPLSQSIHIALMPLTSKLLMNFID